MKSTDKVVASWTETIEGVETDVKVIRPESPAERVAAIEDGEKKVRYQIACLGGVDNCLACISQISNLMIVSQTQHEIKFEGGNCQVYCTCIDAKYVELSKIVRGWGF